MKKCALLLSFSWQPWVFSPSILCSWVRGTATSLNCCGRLGTEVELVLHTVLSFLGSPHLPFPDAHCSESAEAKYYRTKVHFVVCKCCSFS